MVLRERRSAESLRSPRIIRSSIASRTGYLKALMGKRLARYAWLVEVELQLSAAVTEKRYFAIARPDARSAEEAV